MNRSRLSIVDLETGQVAYDLPTLEETYGMPFAHATLSSNDFQLFAVDNAGKLTGPGDKDHRLAIKIVTWDTTLAAKMSPSPKPTRPAASNATTTRAEPLRVVSGTPSPTTTFPNPQPTAVARPKPVSRLDSTEIPKLIAQVADTNELAFVRGEAVERLATLDVEGAVTDEIMQVLIDALHEQQSTTPALPFLKVKLVEALGRFGPRAKSSLPLLIRSLQHTNGDLRMKAAEAIGKVGPDERAVAALKELESDADVRVRLAAAEALRSLGQPK